MMAVSCLCSRCSKTLVSRRQWQQVEGQTCITRIGTVGPVSGTACADVLFNAYWKLFVLRAWSQWVEAVPGFQPQAFGARRARLYGARPHDMRMISGLPSPVTSRRSVARCGRGVQAWGEGDRRSRALCGEIVETQYGEAMGLSAVPRLRPAGSRYLCHATAASPTHVLLRRATRARCRRGTRRAMAPY